MGEQRGVAMRQVDLVVRVGAMLPMTGPSVVYNALLAIDGGRLVYAGEASSADDEYVGKQNVDEPDGVIMPGFIDTHAHVGAHLFGTVCDDENIITALYEIWFPMEGEYTPEITRAGACLGYWDALRGGVTTLGNDEFFPAAVAEAAETVGARSLVANRIIGYAKHAPPVYDRAARAYSLDYDQAEFQRGLEENVAFIENWRGHRTVIPCLGPHTPDTLDTGMLVECARLAEQLDVKMLIHIAQSQAEIAQVRKKGYDGSIYYLNEIGFLSPHVQGAHMVWVDDQEIEVAAASGMGMSWTPTIMMACHSYAKIDKLIESGITIGFGTDCFSMDVLEELRYATYSANFVRGEAGFQLKAFELLRMATVGGARALGLEAEVGTIEAGKRADLIILNLNDAQLIPNTNYFETIVYRAKSRNLTHTIVDGRIVYADGKLQLASEEKLLADGRQAAREWLHRSQDVLERTGVSSRIQPHFEREPPDKPLLGKQSSA
jgi:cytosine/adenosine deaminase-related metal-dependent hydrolase